MKKHNDYRESIERVSNPVLVLRLDTHKNTEELYIAPESRMRDYLQKETEYIKVTPRRDKKNNTDKIFDRHKKAFQGYYVSSEFRCPPKVHYWENEIIYKAIRPLGALMLDFFSLPNSDIFSSLKTSLHATPTDEQYNYCIELLHNLYCCENPICKYLSLKFRDIYEEEVLKYRDSMKHISKCDTNTAQAGYSIMNQAFYSYDEISAKKDLQKLWTIVENQPPESWSHMFSELYRAAYESPVNVILVPGNDKKLCFATTESVLPLIAYYIHVLSNEKRRLRTCPICEKKFLSPDLNKTKLCSPECQDQGKKRSRKNHNTKHEEKSKIYNSKRGYWSYRLKKVRKSGSEKAIEEAYDAYDAFNDAVKEWLESSDTSIEIFFEHEKIIDAILDKYGIPIKGK